MSKFNPLEGDNLPTNFFELDSMRSPTDTMDCDVDLSHTWAPFVQHSSTNPFFLASSLNPFPQTYVNAAPTPLGEPDMIFSSPTTASNVTYSRPLELGKSAPSVFTAFAGDGDLSPAVPSTTHSLFSGPESNVSISAPALLPAASIGPDNDMDADFGDDIGFDGLPFSASSKANANKKNTRVDIPPERTLQNIDELIRNAHSEETVKELRRQKRLLRNRKAALDSRVRKRQYTVSLERAKDDLEEELQAVREKHARLLRETADFNRAMDQARHENEALAHQLRAARLEQEELVRTHTLETGQLRKKIQYLSTKLPQSSNPVPPTPEHTNFTDFLEPSSLGFGDYDSLIGLDNPLSMIPQNMNNGGWPAFQPTIDININSFDTPAPQPQNNKPKKAVESDSQNPATGLLMLLLLCGAFVATKSSGNVAPTIPSMPEEVRVASASVLDTIFQDAGVSTIAATDSTAPSDVATFVSSISNKLSNQRAEEDNGVPLPIETMATQKDSHPLGLLGMNYINPTDLDAAHLFSMSASQYAAINSPLEKTDVVEREDRSHSPQRRSLSDALKALQESKRGKHEDSSVGGKLMWDSIPTQVIREFRRMFDDESSPGAHPSSPVMA